MKTNMSTREVLQYLSDNSSDLSVNSSKLNIDITLDEPVVISDNPTKITQVAAIFTIDSIEGLIIKEYTEPHETPRLGILDLDHDEKLILEIFEQVRLYTNYNDLVNLIELKDEYKKVLLKDNPQTKKLLSIFKNSTENYTVDFIDYYPLGETGWVSLIIDSDEYKSVTGLAKNLSMTEDIKRYHLNNLGFCTYQLLLMLN